MLLYLYKCPVAYYTVYTSWSLPDAYLRGCGMLHSLMQLHWMVCMIWKVVFTNAMSLTKIHLHMCWVFTGLLLPPLSSSLSSPCPILSIQQNQKYYVHYQVIAAPNGLWPMSAHCEALDYATCVLVHEHVYLLMCMYTYACMYTGA